MSPSCLPEIFRAAGKVNALVHLVDLFTKFSLITKASNIVMFEK